MHPSLRLLARLKLRGIVRKQTRRLKSPKHVLFLVVGVTLMIAWLSVLAFPGRSRPARLDPEELRIAIQLGCAALSLLTLTSAFAHRGLYLPQSEIELLLAAPVSRADLVRYRILSSLGRTLFGGLVIGLMVGRHMPERLFGLLGAFAATLILPVVGQGISLLAGSAENRLANTLSKLPIRAINLVLVLGVLLFAVGMTSGPRLGARLAAFGVEGLPEEFLSNPVLGVLLLPFRPWAEAMAAPTWGAFLPWFAACALLWYVAVQLVARIPVDFRELSLATSSDVARRLRRGRRGTGRLSKAAATRRLPWVFGRSPFGAIAWRKAHSILRKARGTMLTGALIIGALTFATTVLFDRSNFDGATDDPVRVVLGPAVIAMIGTIYLCTGLRLDFREDLEQMDIIKSWPLAPWKIFLATLVPEVVLVTGFVLIGLALQVGLTEGWHPVILLIAVAQPFGVLMWTAIDNVVFLLSPIRYTPGQDGALNHTGRAMLLTLLRILVLGVASLGLFAAVGVAYLLQWWLGFDERVFAILSLALGFVVLVLEVTGLVRAGGAAFRRFDVARDRG